MNKCQKNAMLPPNKIKIFTVHCDNIIAHRWVSMRSTGAPYLKFQCISFEVCIQESILFNSQANPVLLVLYLPLLIFHGLPAVTATP
jgi:hypothetical protein